jgi:hypothetical protein
MSQAFPNNVRDTHKNPIKFYTKIQHKHSTSIYDFLSLIYCLSKIQNVDKCNITRGIHNDGEEE